MAVDTDDAGLSASGRLIPRTRRGERIAAAVLVAAALAIAGQFAWQQHRSLTPVPAPAPASPPAPVPAVASATIGAVDASPEVLAINRSRVAAANVDYVEADVFSWRPAARYDAAFFSFWLSHVPEERFAAFWANVARVLAPGGAAYLIDSAFDPTSTAKDHVLPERDAGIVTRRLNDGREFRIVKLFWEPRALAARLSALGWSATLAQTPSYFIHGDAHPS